LSFARELVYFNVKKSRTDYTRKNNRKNKEIRNEEKICDDVEEERRERTNRVH
jgi:hypothetical protein